MSVRVEKAQGDEGLRGTLEVLRRRWLLVLGIVVVCVAVAIVSHERAAKSYQATASVTFRNTTLPDAALQVTESGSGEPVRDAATEVLIAHSAEVAQRVRQQLHIKTAPTELLKLVGVEAAPDADVLHFTASTGEPRYSARLANAFAEQYIAFKAATQLASVESAEHQLQQQLTSLPASSPERASLQQSVQRLEQLRAVAGGSASVIGLATPAASPSGTSLKTTVVIGFLIGLAVAFIVVFLLESLDRRLKTVEEFEREYRLPALAAIPQSSFSVASAAERRASLEPYRILRSALDFVAITRPIDTLLVTSAVSGEGKTTVAVDLAQAVALTGRNVVLAEFDLRRPTFAKHFGTPFRDGLTNMLARGELLSDVLVAPFADLPTLRVLPTGALPPNPSELLGLPVVSELIGALAQDNAMVVIDAPPLNPVADAQVLLNDSAVQAVILVARANLTTREDVRRARAILDRHVVQPIGLAVTGLRDSKRYGYESYEAARSGPGMDPQLSRPHDSSTSRPSSAR